MQNEKEQLEQLQKWDGAHPERLKMEPGAVAVLRVRGTNMVNNQHGECPVVTVEEEATGKEYSLWASAAMLKRQIVELDLQRGDRIAVKYAGPNPAKGYQMYKVVVLERAQDKSEEVPPTKETGGAEFDPFK
jgi:hypothetical protein